MAKLSDLHNAIVKGNLELAVSTTQEALQENIDPQTLISDYLIKGMEEIGTQFEAGKAYVPNLLMSARAMKGALELLKPYMENDKNTISLGKVVIGTVKGDLHDIGKNLVSSMLEGCGFEVINLGVDVSDEKFVEAAKEHKANIVCMSALLTTTMVYMKEVIKAFEKAGIRNDVKIMIGGAPLSEKFAKEIGADYVAHGSTGAGNDQVRFDLTFQILAPEIGIITPTRDMTLTREYEIEYLKKHGYTADFKKMEYSINKGLWGTSIGGKETLKSNQTLPESAYPSQMTATQSKTITLDFVKGEIAGINGKAYDNKVAAIQDLEALAAPYAIGRDMHIGDTIIGIKGRVGFEAAAPMLIIAAHKMLEKHTLTKWQQYWKDQVGTWYGMFLHEAQYLEPVMRDIEAFLDSSQQNVTGRVIIELHPYRYVLVGVESDYDLMKSDFGEYGEVNKAWSADDVKGFTKILGNQMKIFYSVQNKNKK